MTTKSEQSDLINRTEMILIAKEHNLFIARSTIHRWANELGFPNVVGLDGQYLLYKRSDFVSYLLRKLKRVSEDH